MTVGDAAFPATLTATDRGVTVAGRLPASAAAGPVLFQFAGRRSRPVFALVPGVGGPTVRAVPAPTARSAPRARRVLRTGLGRVRRRLRGVA